jgi:hypothetical protein
MRRTFEDHVAKMDKEHPDWLKTNATSHMAVAREFWEGGRQSKSLDRLHDLAVLCSLAWDRLKRKLIPK